MQRIQDVPGSMGRLPVRREPNQRHLRALTPLSRCSLADGRGKVHITLYLTGTEDEVGLAMMAELAEKALREPHPLSGVPLILDDEAWADWMLPEDHPLHRRFKQIETNWLGVRYAEQKKLLDDIHQRQGLDVFVASFSAVRKKDGDMFSYSVWGEGLDSLLPVTQKVAFVRKGRERPVALGDWARVVEVAGGLMEPTEHYPPRYRVREIPDEASLEAIGLGEM
jgi:hypothetical protein